MSLERERTWKRDRLRKRSVSPGLPFGPQHATHHVLWRSLHTYGRGNSLKPLYTAAARERQRQLISAIRKGDEERAERIDPMWDRGEALWNIW